MPEPLNSERDLDSTIAELVEHAGNLAQATSETTRMLADAVAARARSRGDRDPPADPGGPLATDVLEMAKLHAQLAGVRVEDYLREAVLAYSDRPGQAAQGAGPDLRVRLRELRDEALRLRDESMAAQSARAGTRTEQHQGAAEATRPVADRGRDGGPAPPPDAG
jgi:hypothetical protein